MQREKHTVLKKKKADFQTYDCILSNYINIFNYKVGFNGNNKSQTIWVIQCSKFLKKML